MLSKTVADSSAQHGLGRQMREDRFFDINTAESGIPETGQENKQTTFFEGIKTLKMRISGHFWLGLVEILL